MNSTKNITQLLLSMEKGDKPAVEQLFKLIYNELHKISENHLKGERNNHTINATALVHEAYIKIASRDELSIHNRSHFFAVASKCMRGILIDYARKRNAAKRGGSISIITFDEQEVKREIRSDELLILNDTLQELENEVPRASKVVEMKFFGGLTYDEIAKALSVSVPTVRREWRFAQAWLSKAMHSNW